MKVEAERTPEHVEELGFSEFVEDETLGIGLPIMMLVKGFDQRQRSTRLLETFERGDRFVGRKEKRPFSLGSVFLTTLKQNIEHIDEAHWHRELSEPRFVDFSGDNVAVTGAEHVQLMNMATGLERTIENDYFGSLHSSVFDPSGQKLLITSTGFDSILEFDLNSENYWRWTAWEHGYSISPDGTIITTSRGDADDLSKNGQRVLCVENLKELAHFGLPTSYRTTHVNEAIYGKDREHILATFFHQGTIVKIDRHTGNAHTLLTGLRNPHAIKQYAGGFIVTDTRNGCWFQLDSEFRVMRKVSFVEFPGKPAEAKTIEWLQYVSILPQGLFAGIDANRNCIFIFDPVKKVYNKLHVNADWSVQAVVSVSEKDFTRLGQLSS